MYCRTSDLNFCRVGLVLSESGGKEVSIIGDFKICLNFYLWVSLCVSAICVCLGMHRDKEKGIRSYGAVVKDSCELPGMGAGLQTPVLEIQYGQSFL